MTFKQIAVGVFIALCVVGGFWVMGDALKALDVPPEPTEPHFDEHAVSEAPPLLDPAPAMAQRRSYWLRMLTTGDERDVQWAVQQLRNDGDPGRQLVLAAAQRSVRSNRALVQQALEFLLSDPREDCYPLVRDVLESDDPHAVTRALLLLAKLGELGEPVAPRLATLAVEREYPIPQYAMTALAAIGTQAAEDAAKDAVTRMDADQRGFGYVALAQMARPGIVDYLKQAFAMETDPRTKLAAAEGLVRSDDTSPTDWLRSELEHTTPGSTQFEGALAVLAQAQHEVAHRILADRAEDRLDTGKRRANAIEALAPFSYEMLKSTLVRCGRAGEPVDARVAAWDQMVRKGPRAAYEDLLAMLLAPGAGGSDDRRVAALVLGRLERPESAPALIDGLARLDATEKEERSLYLRALCLTGSPDAAEVVARAVAADHTGFGRGGTAFDVFGVLGDLAPDVRAQFGVQFERALAEEFGPVAGSGLQVLLIAMPTCAGPDAAPRIERFVHHEEREIRDSAITALAFVGRPRSLDVLTRAWHKKQDDLLRANLRDAMLKLQNLAL